MDNTEKGADGSKDKDKPVTLVIGTPKGTVTGKFEPSATIAEVIAYAIEQKQLGGGSDAFELYLRVGDEKQLLTPTDRTLESFGVKAGAKLILAAHGSGV